MEKGVGVYIRNKNVPIVAGFKERKKLRCSFSMVFRVCAKRHGQGLCPAAADVCFLELLVVNFC